MSRGFVQAMAFLAAASALWATKSVLSQTPTFSSRIDQVRVDVLVTENGRPVGGLATADFEVFDEGVRQQVELVSSEPIPIDVVLAFDASGSVIGERLNQLRSAAESFLGQLRREDRAALVTFSHVVVQGSDLTDDLQRVRTALLQAPSSGETSLRDGVFAALMLGGVTTGRSLLLVFSDGLDTSSWLTPTAVLESAKNRDVVTYAVSLGGSKTPFLDDLASVTAGRVIHVESTRDLGASFLSILDEFRQRYIIGYVPQGISKSGWHRLTVRVNRKNMKVVARSGYMAGP